MAFFPGMTRFLAPKRTPRRFSSYGIWDSPREAVSGATRFSVRTALSHNKRIRLTSVNKLDGGPKYGHDSNMVGGLHTLEFVVVVVV